MRKKLRSWVRPGVRETRASPRWWAKALRRLDLPTFERPVTAISGRSPGGASRSFGALFSKLAWISRQPSAAGLDSAVLIGGRVADRSAVQDAQGSLIWP